MSAELRSDSINRTGTVSPLPTIKIESSKTSVRNERVFSGQKMNDLVNSALISSDSDESENVFSPKIVEKSSLTKTSKNFDEQQETKGKPALNCFFIFCKYLIKKSNYETNKYFQLHH